MTNRFIRARALSAALLLLIGTILLPRGAAAAPAPASARATVATPDLVALVTDSAGAPIAEATVLVVETGRVATTGRDGRVVLRGLPAGRLHLAVSRADGTAVTVTVRLAQAAVVLPGVQVTAAASDGDPTRSTQATVVLDGRALQLRQAPSVAQVLAAEPGMAMRFNGPIANVPVIRGLTGERIVLLQDGERRRAGRRSRGDRRRSPAGGGSGAGGTGRGDPRAGVAALRVERDRRRGERRRR
ncbi:MAG: Plug and carboxypeptidase regulatory-like domain-containing protein [Gemmatimonadaceae bacterium]|nr:Plug and carboxypeptidase regulatory-like domain-containing protein [Gemmatimonadaceae bacterium]